MKKLVKIGNCCIPNSKAKLSPLPVRWPCLKKYSVTGLTMAVTSQLCGQRMVSYLDTTSMRATGKGGITNREPSAPAALNQGTPDRASSPWRLALKKARLARTPVMMAAAMTTVKIAPTPARPKYASASRMLKCIPVVRKIHASSRCGTCPAFVPSSTGHRSSS